MLLLYAMLMRCIGGTSRANAWSWLAAKQETLTDERYAARWINVAFDLQFAVKQIYTFLTFFFSVSKRKLNRLCPTTLRPKVNFTLSLYFPSIPCSGKLWWRYAILTVPPIGNDSTVSARFWQSGIVNRNLQRNVHSHMTTMRRWKPATPDVKHIPQDKMRRRDFDE